MLSSRSICVRIQKLVVLTGIGGGDHAGALEVAGAAGLALRLVVGVEGERGVAPHVVGLVAPLPGLYRRAVRPAGAACPVHGSLHRLLVRVVRRDAERPVRRVVPQETVLPGHVEQVHRRAVAVEEPPVGLRRRPRPQVLVEELVDVHARLRAGPHRRPGLLRDMLDEVGVVRVGVVLAGVRLLLAVPVGRPPGLGDQHRDAGADVEVLEGDVHRVEHGVEHVGVVEQRVGVDHLQRRRERLEHGVVDGDDATALHQRVVGVEVEHEGRGGVGEVGEEREEEGFGEGLVEVGLGRGEGLEDDGERERGGDGDGGEVGGGERGGEGLDGGEEDGERGGQGGGDLVADGDGGDEARGG
ncbi:hypothetical protein CFC21_016591 [Triticum aestivum]|uniref:Uncharacterized protein n=2 Tax=Triticum aestivum TaxID=4565 RepID=A0A9R1J1M8_WHEAT|nr:hypothetical protein CFC21_016591 [Triticum aestivum]